jgi:hypothetical protein
VNRQSNVGLSVERLVLQHYEVERHGHNAVHWL